MASNEGISHNQSLGRRLHLLRERKNLTMTEVARKLRVSKANLDLWERGKRELHPTMLTGIASYYKVSENWLRTGVAESDFERELNEADLSINPESVAPEDIIPRHDKPPVTENAAGEKAFATQISDKRLNALLFIINALPDDAYGRVWGYLDELYSEELSEAN